MEGLTGHSVVKSLPASAGDSGLILGLGRFHMQWGNWNIGIVSPLFIPEMLLFLWDLY